VSKALRLGGLLAVLVALRCYAGPVYPDIPTRTLPAIQKLPANDEIILEIRSDLLSGDPITPPGSSAGPVVSNDLAIEVDVYDRSTRSESIWDLLHGVPLRLYLSSCCMMRASWAPRAKKLLLALNDGAYLVDPNGQYSKLTLKMPGIAVAYRQAAQFAVSDDASHLLFRLFGRDSGDKYLDPADPYALKIGRMYQDILYEDLPGSEPRSVAKGKTLYRSNGEPESEFVSVPAWSADQKRIAYARAAGKSVELVVAESDNGQILWAMPIEVKGLLMPAIIKEIRWNPDDTKLAIVVYEGTPGSWDSSQRSELYVVDADGKNEKVMTFGGRNMNVSSFAWSPSGRKVAFRSDFSAPRLCNHNLMFLAQAGFEPCRVSENLFTSNLDGSGLERVSKEPQFRAAQVFWIN
jgi:hypothetical protein